MDPLCLVFAVLASILLVFVLLFMFGQWDARRTAEIAKEEEAREAREADILPAKCFTMLLKYVALGDRRIGDGEKLHIAGVVRRAFPGKLTEAELRLLVDHATPEYHQIGALAVPFLGMSEDGRRNLLAIIASVAGADGKATKSEKERLAAIQAVLGL